MFFTISVGRSMLVGQRRMKSLTRLFVSLTVCPSACRSVNKFSQDWIISIS